MTATDEPATPPVPGMNATEQRQWEAAGQLRVVTPSVPVKTRRPVTAFIHAALTLVPHRLRDAWPTRPPAATATARPMPGRAVSRGEGHGAGPER